MKKITVLVALLLLTALVGGVVAQNTPYYEDDVVLYGFIVDESGIGAIFADSQVKGVEMAIADLNEAGGILGREVQFIRQDSELDAETGTNIARQFIAEDNVDFLLGPTSSGVALAVSEVARENERVIAFHTSNTKALTTTNGHDFMVQVVPHTTIEARAAALYAAANLDFTDYASIGPDYSFGRDSFEAFEPALTANSDAAVISQQWPALSEPDLTPFITAVQNSGAEILYSNAWGAQAVNILQTGNDFGLFEEIQMIGLFDTDFMKAFEGTTDLPEGLYGYARAPFYGIVDENGEMTEAISAFVDEYVETYDAYPSDWAIMAYDAVMVLAEAAEVAGTTEGPAVAEALGGLTWDSLRGELTIRDCDHMANVGEYVGVTAYSDVYPFPILTDVEFVPAEDVWYTCEEVADFRAGTE
jgi:branched-chain amino acid transport system substrate-binding protein